MKCPRSIARRRTHGSGHCLNNARVDIGSKGMPPAQSIPARVEKFNKTYGALITFAWRFLFYPIIALVLFSASSYMQNHYVDREHFDAAVVKVESGQKEITEKVVSGQREISGKVDAVLIQQATATAKREELERRLIRLENFSDGKHSAGTAGESRFSLTSAR